MVVSCGDIESKEEKTCREQAKRARITVVSDSYRLGVAKRAKVRAQAEYERLCEEVAQAGRKLRREKRVKKGRARRFRSSEKRYKASWVWY